MATKPERIPLAQPIQSRGPLFSTDSYSQNVVFEQNDAGMCVLKRPGLIDQLISPEQYTPFVGYTVNRVLSIFDFHLTDKSVCTFAIIEWFANPNYSIYIVNVSPATFPSPTGGSLNTIAAGSFNQSILTGITPATNYNYIPVTAVPNLNPNTTFSLQPSPGDGSIWFVLNQFGSLYCLYISYNGSTTCAFNLSPGIAQTSSSISPSRSVYLDNYIFFCSSNGAIFNTQLVPIPTTLNYYASGSNPFAGVFTATNVIYTYGEFGDQIAIIKHLNYLIAFKEFSCEFYYDAGNPTGSTPGSPLGNYIQARQTIGCANQDSLCGFKDTIIWVGQGPMQGKSIYIMNGLVPTRISNEYIDKYLDKDTCISVNAVTTQVAGHRLYILSLLTLNVTLVYDFSTQQWYRWSGWTGSFDTVFPAIGSYVGKYDPNNQEYIWGKSPVTGLYRVYDLDANTYQDNFVQINVVIQTDTEDWGTRQPKTFGRLDVIADQQNNSTLRISHSDDDFNTYSPVRTVDLSQQRPVLFQGGRARKRAYLIQHTANVPFRGEYLELDIKPGS